MGAVKRTHKLARKRQQLKREFKKFVWDGWVHRPLDKKRRHYKALLKEFLSNEENYA